MDLSQKRQQNRTRPPFSVFTFSTQSLYNYYIIQYVDVTVLFLFKMKLKLGATFRKEVTLKSTQCQNESVIANTPIREIV